MAAGAGARCALLGVSAWVLRPGPVCAVEGGSWPWWRWHGQKARTAHVGVIGCSCFQWAGWCFEEQYFSSTCGWEETPVKSPQLCRS